MFWFLSRCHLSRLQTTLKVSLSRRGLSGAKVFLQQMQSSKEFPLWVSLIFNQQDWARLFGLTGVRSDIESD